MKIYCHLKGSMYCEGQDFLRKVLSSGQTLRPENLRLIRQPDNPKDPNCVQVWYAQGDEKIRLGFVNKENAPRVASYMDSGGTANIISTKFYGAIDKGQNAGMYFLVNAVSRQN